MKMTISDELVLHREKSVPSTMSSDDRFRFIRARLPPNLSAPLQTDLDYFAGSLLPLHNDLLSPRMLLAVVHQLAAKHTVDISGAFPMSRSLQTKVLRLIYTDPLFLDPIFAVNFPPQIQIIHRLIAEAQSVLHFSDDLARVAVNYAVRTNRKPATAVAGILMAILSYTRDSNALRNAVLAITHVHPASLYAAKNYFDDLGAALPIEPDFLPDPTPDDPQFVLPPVEADWHLHHRILAYLSQHSEWVSCRDLRAALNVPRAISARVVRTLIGKSYITALKDTRNKGFLLQIKIPVRMI
jgi:hypothetical protein